MFFRVLIFRALILGAFVGIACKQGPITTIVQRTAVLRFENLSGSPLEDWQGRALSELLKRRFGAGRMPRASSSAPGISTERMAAIDAGATRLIAGYYTANGNSLTVSAFAEDVATMKLSGPLHASGSVSQIADEIAKQFHASSTNRLTSNDAALKEFSLAADSTGSDALNHYDLALKADPSLGSAYLGAIETAVFLRDPTRAQSILSQASAHGAALAPEDRAYLQLESARLDRNTAGQADALKAVVALDANDTQALRALADAEMTARQPQDAARHYGQLVTRFPEDPNLRNLLTYAALFAGDETLARSAAREYQRLHPQDPNSFDTAGDVELAFGHFAEAEKIYLTSPDPAFQDCSASWKAACSRLMSGDSAGASSLFQKHRAALAAVNPSAADFRSAEWLHLIGRPAEAMEAMAAFAAREKKPEWLSADYTQAAIWAVLSHDRVHAVKWADRALHPAQKSTFVLAAMSRFLAQEPAAPAVWKARSESNFSGTSASEIRRQALGYALLLAKHFSEASEPWRQIYRASTVNDTPAAYLYAWTLLETGHRAEAAPLLRLNPIPTAGVAPSFEALYVPAAIEWRKSSLRQ